MCGGVGCTNLVAWVMGMTYLCPMANRFDDAFEPPAPGSTGVSAVQSVQSSLYMRLKKTYGSKAGAMGWILIRLGQFDHPENGDANAALLRNPAALSPLLAVAKATAAAPVVSGRAESAELASNIVEALGILLTASASGEKR